MNAFSSNRKNLIWVMLLIICAVLGVLVITNPDYFVPPQMVTQDVIGTGLKAAPTLGVVIDGDLRVIDVESGGTAEQAGIQKGDMLKSINEVTLTSPEQARRVFQESDPTRVLQVGVTRAGSDLKLTASPISRIGVAGAATATPVPPDLMYF